MAIALCIATVAAQDFGLKDYSRVAKILPHAEAKTWRLVSTMLHNCQFQSWIEVEAPAGLELKFNS